MVRPIGIPQAAYIRPLTEALGWGSYFQKLRDVLKKQAGIHPYSGKEKEALEYLIKQGYDLRKYQPLDDNAKLFLEQHYAKPSSIPQPLALTSEEDATTAWDRKLVPRLSRLLTRDIMKRMGHPESWADDDTKRKFMTRNILKSEGYEKPWEDEARGLAIFRKVGIPIDGFEYLNGSAVAPIHEQPQPSASLPAEIERMSVEELRHEVVKLRQQVDTLHLSKRLKQSRMDRGVGLLNRAVKTAYGGLRERQQYDPEAEFTDAELIADMARREFRHKSPEED